MHKKLPLFYTFFISFKNTEATFSYKDILDLECIPILK